MGRSDADEKLSDAETERRFRGALKRMLATPHKPHAPKGRKRKAKAKKSVRAKPRSRGA